MLKPEGDGFTALGISRSLTAPSCLTYLDFFGERPKPARITTGTSGLVLGACIEIDLVAKMPTAPAAKK